MIRGITLLFERGNEKEKNTQIGSRLGVTWQAPLMASLSSSSSLIASFCRFARPANTGSSLPECKIKKGKTNQSYCYCKQTLRDCMQQLQKKRYGKAKKCKKEFSFLLQVRIEVKKKKADSKLK